MDSKDGIPSGFIKQKSYGRREKKPEYKHEAKADDYDKEKDAGNQALS